LHTTIIGDVMRKFPVKFKVRFFGDKVSRQLAIFCLIFAFIVFISQIFLKNEQTREIFTEIEKYENISYGKNEIFKEGYVVLKLENAKPSDKIEIWFNGDKIDVFKTEKQKITIECDGVIEVKNDSSSKILVSVDKTSENIDLLMDNKAEINSGIRVICSLRFK